MPRRCRSEPLTPRRQTASGPAPTREAILDFLKREREAGQTAKIGKREIARAFGIKGSDRIALKRVLKELEDEGAIERRRKTLHRPGTLPSVVLADVTGRDKDGELLAVPVEWDPEHGPVPKILIMPTRQRQGTPTPGVGDRALMRTEILPDAGPGEPAYSGSRLRGSAGAWQRACHFLTRISSRWSAMARRKGRRASVRSSRPKIRTSRGGSGTYEGGTSRPIPIHWRKANSGANAAASAATVG